MKIRVPYQVYIFLIEFGIFTLVLSISNALLDKVTDDHKSLKRIVSLILGAIAVSFAHYSRVADILT